MSTSVWLKNTNRFRTVSSDTPAVTILHLLLKSSVPFAFYLVSKSFRLTRAQYFSIGRSSGQFGGLVVFGTCLTSCTFYHSRTRQVATSGQNRAGESWLLISGSNRFRRHSFSYISLLIVPVETKLLDFRPQLHMACQIKYFFGNLDTVFVRKCLETTFLRIVV